MNWFVVGLIAVFVIASVYADRDIFSFHSEE